MLRYAAAVTYISTHSSKLTEKDSIVVADFANTTGDPVFDVTLREGLSVQLEQTPFIKLVSDDQIREVLRLMEKPRDTPLTPDVAREICQRANATTVIDGSIAALGDQYVLALKALNCSSGETFAGEQVTADGEEERNRRPRQGLVRTPFQARRVPRLTPGIRCSAGPSHDPVARGLASLVFGQPGSLEAMTDSSAISFVERAVSIDPDFATAYGTEGGRVLFPG